MLSAAEGVRSARLREGLKLKGVDVVLDRDLLSCTSLISLFNQAITAEDGNKTMSGRLVSQPSELGDPKVLTLLI